MRHRIASGLTGEWILARHPNGGNVIAFRAVQVGLTIYIPAALIHSWAVAQWSFQFSLDAAAAEVASTLSWLGASIAAVYVALYTRFSAQWSYLAGFYNQIMALNIERSPSLPCPTISEPAPSTSKSSNDLDPSDNDESEAVNLWYAAFVEDALALHLATKTIFAETVWDLLERPSVQKIFDESATSGGATARANLQSKLRSKFPALRTTKNSADP